MVGLAGEGQNFDGNGPYVRFQPGGGDADDLDRQVDGRRSARRHAVRQRAVQAARHAARLPEQAPALQLRQALLHQKLPDLNGADRPG